MSEKKETDKKGLIATALVCHICGASQFDEKKHSGNILLHCSGCGGKARVSVAGVVNVKAIETYEESKVFADPKEKPAAKKDKDTIFRELRYVVPEPSKDIITLATWCAKAMCRATGKWYAGSMLTHICADFLSGFDFNCLDAKTYDKIKPIIDRINDTAASEEDLDKKLEEVQQDQYRELTKGQVKTTIVITDKVKAAGEVIEKRKEENRTKGTKAMIRGKATGAVSRRLKKLEDAGLTEEEKGKFYAPGQEILSLLEAGKMAGDNSSVKEYNDRVDTFLVTKEKLLKFEAKKAEPEEVTEEKCIEFLQKQLVNTRIEMGKAKSSGSADEEAMIQQTIEEIKVSIAGLKDGSLIADDVSDLMKSLRG